MEPQATSPGVLGTKIPSTVLFTIGVLLFFMPFAELKCNQSNTNTELGGLNLNLGGQMSVSNTGLGLAIGKEWKMEMHGLGGMLNSNNKLNKEQPKQDPNYYAIAALALGVIGDELVWIRAVQNHWQSPQFHVRNDVAKFG